MSIFDAIIMEANERAKAAAGSDPSDYMGTDGLLYCGRCNTPKQCRHTAFSKEYVLYVMCQCRKDAERAAEATQKRREELDRIAELRAAGFPDAEMRHWTFDADDRANAGLSTVASRYVQNWQTMRDAGKGLILFGAVGTGKTFAAACIANALIDAGYAVLMTNFTRLTNALQSAQDKQRVLDDVARYDLLIIDDLAAERDTEYMGEMVQSIIDARYRSKRPLIVTTNLSAAELKNPQDIRRQRIYSRLLEMCIPYEVNGADRRRQIFRRDYGTYEKMLGIGGNEQ